MLFKKQSTQTQTKLAFDICENRGLKRFVATPNLDIKEVFFFKKNITSSKDKKTT